MKEKFFLNVSGVRKMVEVDREDMMVAAKKVICDLVTDEEIDGFRGLANRYLEEAGISEDYNESLETQMKLWVLDNIREKLSEC